MNSISNRFKALSYPFHRAYFVVTGILFVLVTILWLPFGFRNSGLVEEWTFILGFDRGQVWLQGIPANRIVIPIPYWLGYLLTPNSFVGMGIILFVLLLGQGVVYYLFFRQLTNNSSVAFITAILGIVYPASTGLFYLRLLNYQLSPLFYFFAAYLLLLYWEQASKVKLVMMWGAMLVTIWVTELAIPTICLTPLFLLYQEKRINKRLFKVAALWYTPLIGTLLAWFYMYLTDKLAYLTNIADDNTNYTFSENIKDIFRAMGRAYRRAYYDGWYEGLQNVNLWFVALAIGFATLVFTFTLIQLRRQQSSPNRKTHLVWLVVGLGLFLMGILPFLLAPTYRHITDRFYFMASPWAALSVASMLCLISTGFSKNIQPYIFSSLAGLVVVWAMQYAFQQHQNAAHLSTVERDVLTTIVKTVPNPEDTQAIVLYDESGHLIANDYGFGMIVTYVQLRDALSYIYGKPVQAFSCGGLFYRCEFDSHNFYYYYIPDNQLVAKIRLDSVILFKYCYSTTLMEQIPIQFTSEPIGDNYNPWAIIRPDQPPPRRLASLFHDWVVDFDTDPFTPLTENRFEFDKTPPGCGWSYVEADTGTIWTTSNTSTLLYQLDPVEYRISFGVVFTLQPELLSSLKLYVNDTSIPLTQSTDAKGAIVFEGVIPREAISANQEPSELKFVVDHVVSPESLGLSDDSRLLGLLFDWIQVTPIPK